MLRLLPSWFKQEIPDNKTAGLKSIINEFGLNTVCREARCPNLGACFKERRATFMILGDTCTRNCSFCAVKKSSLNPQPLSLDEPERVAEAVKKMGLRYAVITSVTRDDLPGGGAEIFARTIKAVRKTSGSLGVEVLIPDFQGRRDSLKNVLDVRPDVLAHNMETVKRLYPEIRPKANYQLSLGILAESKKIAPSVITKSSLMLGMGEREEEIINTMKELVLAGCDILTLGQYLSPSPVHYPVKEYILPQKFDKLRDIGISLGFKYVLSAPLARSSYKAEEAFREAKGA